MDIALPLVIQGPAYVTFGGQTIYVKKDIALNQAPESWTLESSFGPLGQRHKSTKDVAQITPVGMISAGLLTLFYGAYTAPVGAIGKTVLSGAMCIGSLNDNKLYTWKRGGITKPPGLSLKPSATAFGPMEISCIGMNGVQPLTANWITAAEAALVADTTFDESKIVADIYVASLGARLAPFNAMGGMDGFDIEFGYDVVEIPNSDVGIADIVLSGLSTKCTFAPSNLSDTDLDTLLARQGPGAILPGQSYAKAGEALKISGTQSGFDFTLANMGARRADRVYVIGEHRHKLIEFVNEVKHTAGVMQPLLATDLLP